MKTLSEIKDATINDILLELKRRKKRANIKLVQKAFDLSNHKHANQFRKSGEPYIIHPLQVGYILACIDLDESTICAALLHDIVEDTNVGYDELKEFGYSDELLEMLSFLTKKKGEYYPDYIDRLISSNNIHVLNIKLSDLRHNMDIGRIKNPTMNDYERINKRYMPAYNKIQSKLEELTKKKNK